MQRVLNTSMHARFQGTLSAAKYSYTFLMVVLPLQLLAASLRPLLSFCRWLVLESSAAAHRSIDRPLRRLQGKAVPPLPDDEIAPTDAEVREALQLPYIVSDPYAEDEFDGLCIDSC